MERRIQADDLTEEWPHFFMAVGISDAKCLACLDPMTLVQPSGLSDLGIWPLGLDIDTTP